MTLAALQHWRVSLVASLGLPAIPSPTISVSSGDHPAVRRFGFGPIVRSTDSVANQHSATGWPVNSGEQIQQPALSAARWSHHGGQCPRFGPKVDPIAQRATAALEPQPDGFHGQSVQTQKEFRADIHHQRTHAKPVEARDLDPPLRRESAAVDENPFSGVEIADEKPVTRPPQGGMAWGDALALQLDGAIGAGAEDAFKVALHAGLLPVMGRGLQTWSFRRCRQLSRRLTPRSAHRRLSA